MTQQNVFLNVYDSCQYKFFFKYNINSFICIYFSGVPSSPVDDPENSSTPLKEEITDGTENSTQDTDLNEIVINKYKNCQIGDNNTLNVDNSQNRSETLNKVKINYTVLGPLILNSNVSSNRNMPASPSSESESPSQCLDEGNDLTPNPRMEQLKSFQSHGIKGLPEDLTMDCSNVPPAQVSQNLQSTFVAT